MNEGYPAGMMFASGYSTTHGSAALRMMFPRKAKRKGWAYQVLLVFQFCRPILD
jgi:hypothetical protein